ncbi:ParM/StbA family protein [Clostridium estertheticum]|uniref:ParM/StbA family protein n=1 Tax=Clostridium estertheticum TaxID=238834 RepID=UPI001C7D56D2|nr:ParM/StbA family protein [Clostridium estertheticum]MBX4267145.1 ParM/StbA family protein [Clostridium estertheticum]MBX4272220.1 ParM/StbA family protein [Clostridium estertheticum]WLC82448.1 ParM/StbA family protein [Clostridium estertheticum]WLC91322.1 ParM/StbA family protein [Clostridium estertheticum]
MGKKDIIIDLGNGAVKFRNGKNELVCFKSTTKLNSNEYDMTGKHEIILHEGINNNIYYVIGDEEGEYCVTQRRYITENYKALLFTAIGIALESEEENKEENKESIIGVNLGINLPLTIYKEKNMEIIIKNKFESKIFEFKVDNNEYKIKIENVIVMPENLVVGLLKQDEVKYKNLFFDLGNGTIDILFTEGTKLGAMKTEYIGIDTLIKTMCEKSGARKNQLIKYWDNLSEISVKGNQKNLNDIKEDTLMDYVSELIRIAENVNGGNLDDVNRIYLLGGGANLIEKTMKMFIKNDIKVFDNPQFTNLLCLEEMFKNIK